MANTNLRIKEICKERNITIKELSELIGTNYVSFVQAMTRNVFSIPKLNEIANALGVEIPELFESYKTIMDKGENSIDANCKCPHCHKDLFIIIK